MAQTQPKSERSWIDEIVANANRRVNEWPDWKKQYMSFSAPVEGESVSSIQSNSEPKKDRPPDS